MASKRWDKMVDAVTQSTHGRMAMVDPRDVVKLLFYLRPGAGGVEEVPIGTVLLQQTACITKS